MLNIDSTALLATNESVNILASGTGGVDPQAKGSIVDIPPRGSCFPILCVSLDDCRNAILQLHTVMRTAAIE